MAPKEQSTVITMQYLRGFATSLVGIQHATSVPAFGGYFKFPIGEWGVDIFFVVSGYIMWATTVSGSRGIFAFWTARVLRVVPIYWFFTTLYIAVALVLPHTLFNAGLDLTHIIKSYFFIPASHPTLHGPVPVYQPGWTLNYEMYFYFLFGFCLLVPQLVPRLVGIVGFLVLLVLIGIVTAPVNPIGDVWTNTILLDFAVGIVLAWFAPRLQRLPPAFGFILIGAALVWALTALTRDVLPPRIVSFAPPAIAMVTGCLILEPLARKYPNRLGLLIGDASYSIYLAHAFTQRIWYFAFMALLGVGSTFLTTLFITTAWIAGLTGGVIAYWLVEKPVHQWGRRIVRNLGAVPKTRTVAPEAT
jgi:exopolysaccharide production protein ExoZ